MTDYHQRFRERFPEEVFTDEYLAFIDEVYQQGRSAGYGECLSDDWKEEGRQAERASLIEKIEGMKLFNGWKEETQDYAHTIGYNKALSELLTHLRSEGEKRGVEVNIHETGQCWCNVGVKAHLRSGEECGEWTGKDSYDCDRDTARTKQGTCRCPCHPPPEPPKDISARISFYEPRFSTNAVGKKPPKETGCCNSKPREPHTHGEGSDRPQGEKNLTPPKL